MHRMIVLLACLAVFLSLGSGSVAHAMEPIACIDAGTAAETGHADGDGDQVPSDSDKGYPHHHGGCHGHHVATETAKAEPAQLHEAGAHMRPTDGLALAASTGDPALRPPQA